MKRHLNKTGFRAGIFFATVVAVCVLCFACSGKETEKKMAADTAKMMSDIEVQVAKDAEQEFMIVLKNGDVMESYVYAGICAAAWLQAKNEEKYKYWKGVEKQLEEKLGL